MIRRVTPLLLLLATAAAPVPAARAQGDPSWRVVGDSVRTLGPGTSGTALFRLEHAGPDTLEAQLELDLPPHWTLLSQPGPTTVAPGASVNRLIAYRVPDRALPGTYAVTAALIDAAGDSLGVASVHVRITERRALSASVLAGPPVAAFGAPVRIRFVVVNDGNTHETVDLDVLSSLGAPVHLSADRLRLAPYSAAEVVADVESGSPTPTGDSHLVRLMASASGPSGRAVTARAQTRLDLVPEGRDPDAGTGDGLPVELGVIASGRAGDVGRQVTLAATDLPLGSGKAWIGLRGPTMRASGPFVQQSAYVMGYEDRAGRIVVGDQVFRQSRLTEYGINGFGAFAERAFGRTGVSVYALQTRYRFPERSQMGLTTDWRVHPRLALRLHGMARRDFEDAGLVSLDTEWRPGDRTSLQAEYGVGAFAGARGTGLRLQLTHADRTRRLDLRFQNATAFFPGSFRGTRQIHVGGSHDLGSLASIEGAWGQNRRAVDFSRSAPTTTGYARLGTGLRLPPIRGIRMTASASANRRFREDARPELTRSERYGALGLGLNHTRATVRLTVEAGRMQAMDGDRSFRRSDITLFLRWSDLTVSGSWVHEDGPRYHYPVATARSQWSLSLDYQAGRAVRVGLDGFASRFEDRHLAASRYLNGRVDLELPHGQRLTARLRLLETRTSVSTDAEAVGGIAYTVPLSMPVSRAREGVSGRVLLAADGSPVHGALVLLGDRRVLTDARGAFAFGRTRGGDRLRVDPGADGRGLVVMNPDALRLVERGRGADIDILLAEGATIRGHLALERPANSGTDAMGPAIPGAPGNGVMVVASDGRDERHALSDSEGRFTLSGLPPGAWRLRVLASTLPEGLEATGEAAVDLQPGDSAHVVIPVRPRQRTIRMVGSASLSVTRADIPAPIETRIFPYPEPPVQRPSGRHPGDPGVQAPKEPAPSMTGSRSTDLLLLPLAAHDRGSVPWPTVASHVQGTPAPRPTPASPWSRLLGWIALLFFAMRVTGTRSRPAHPAPPAR